MQYKIWYIHILTFKTIIGIQNGHLFGTTIYVSYQSHLRCPGRTVPDRQAFHTATPRSRHIASLRSSAEDVCQIVAGVLLGGA